MIQFLEAKENTALDGTHSNFLRSNLKVNYMRTSFLRTILL